MARFLLERGADLTIRDPNHNATALGWANYCGPNAVTACFLEDETRLDLADCVECGLLARVQTLLGDGDPDQPVGSSSPGALLRIAAYEGQLEVARYLLERGADPNRATPDGKILRNFSRVFPGASVISSCGQASGFLLRKQEKIRLSQPTVLWMQGFASI